MDKNDTNHDDQGPGSYYYFIHKINTLAVPSIAFRNAS